MPDLKEMNDYPVFHGKIVVLLSGFNNMDSCRAWYFPHAQALSLLPEVTEYRANIVSSDPVPELTKNNGADPYGVQAVDEIKGAVWKNLQAYYKDVSILGAYLVTEYCLRDIETDRPLGNPTPELKRFGLLTKPENKSHDEAMRCWIENHPALCYRYLAGMSAYFQNHIDAALTPSSLLLDGFPALSYWNEAALRYGHFCSKKAKQILAEDCMTFRSTSYIVNVTEYIMKKEIM